ncbi:MAG: hypothetical protein R6U32_04030 [Candidatus Woesearchaeota archaeon]
MAEQEEVSAQDLITKNMEWLIKDTDLGEAAGTITALIRGFVNHPEVTSKAVKYMIDFNHKQ